MQDLFTLQEAGLKLCRNPWHLQGPDYALLSCLNIFKVYWKHQKDTAREIFLRDLSVLLIDDLWKWFLRLKKKLIH